MIESVTAWRFEDFDGRAIRTPHYTIYTTNDSPMIVDRLPAFMEGALAHYLTAITPLGRPGARMDTFVMDNRSQWQRLTLRMLGESGLPVTFIERGGFATGGRAYLFDIGAADTLSIASHEGWHQFTQSTFRERLPLALEEGLAAFMEGHRWFGREVVFLGWYNLERYDALRDAVSGRAGPRLDLEELLGSSPQAMMSRGPRAPLSYYAQAWALVHFLREGEAGRYSAGFRRMVADAARGTMYVTIAAEMAKTQERISPVGLARQAMRAYINPDLLALAAEYDAFVRRVAATGGRDAVVQGRSPLSPTR